MAAAPPTRFVCGYLACSRSVSRLRSEALPRVLRIPIGEGPAARRCCANCCGSACANPFGHAAGADPCSPSCPSHMFVGTRCAVTSKTCRPASKGWLAGVCDAQIGRALALLHAKPERPWTVDELAREVALSRSAFAERFAATVGEPPIQYLMRWRLALAAQTLRSAWDAIARVAEHSGYSREAAFSRAFKREFGMSPAAWRKAGSQGSSPPSGRSDRFAAVNRTAHAGNSGRRFGSFTGPTTTTTALDRRGSSLCGGPGAASSGANCG